MVPLHFFCRPSDGVTTVRGNSGNVAEFSPVLVGTPREFVVRSFLFPLTNVCCHRCSNTQQQCVPNLRIEYSGDSAKAIRHEGRRCVSVSCRGQCQATLRETSRDVTSRPGDVALSARRVGMAPFFSAADLCRKNVQVLTGMPTFHKGVRITQLRRNVAHIRSQVILRVRLAFLI